MVVFDNKVSQLYVTDTMVVEFDNKMSQLYVTKWSLDKLI